MPKENFLNEFIPGFVSQGAFKLGELGIRELFKKITEGSGEAVTKHVKDYITVKHGLDSDDETEYTDALQLLDSNERKMLGERLRDLVVTTDPKLTQERFNWFRIIHVCGDSAKLADKLKRIIELEKRHGPMKASSLIYTAKGMKVLPLNGLMII